MWLSFSFAPLGLGLGRLPTHGLRRGLHSYAASRLNTASSVSMCILKPLALLGNLGFQVTHLAGLVVSDGFEDLFASVHHKGAVAENRFVDGLAAED